MAPLTSLNLGLSRTNWVTSVAWPLTWPGAFLCRLGQAADQVLPLPPLDFLVKTPGICQSHNVVICTRKMENEHAVNRNSWEIFSRSEATTNYYKHAIHPTSSSFISTKLTNARKQTLYHLELDIQTIQSTSKVLEYFATWLGKYNIKSNIILFCHLN